MHFCGSYLKNSRKAQGYLYNSENTCKGNDRLERKKGITRKGKEKEVKGKKERNK